MQHVKYHVFKFIFIECETFSFTKNKTKQKQTLFQRKWYKDQCENFNSDEILSILREIELYQNLEK